MGLKSKLLIVLPLVIFGAIIFSIGMYNTICKNSNVNILDC